MSKPFLLGITGGIGVGKSTVARFFRQLAVTVIDADTLVHACLHSSQPLYVQVLQRFGPVILDHSGEIDRLKLRAIVFDHPESRRWLEACLHEMVWAELEKAANQAQSAYVALEVPLLIESGYVNRVNRVLLVEAEPAIRCQRIRSRDASMTTAMIENIMAVQAPVERLRAHAHDRVDNNGSLNTLKTAVDHLHLAYLGRRTTRQELTSSPH